MAEANGDGKGPEKPWQLLEERSSTAERPLTTIDLGLDDEPDGKAQETPSAKEASVAADATVVPFSGVESQV